MSKEDDDVNGKAQEIAQLNLKDAAADWMSEEWDKLYHPLVNLCESPIEQIMLAELAFCAFGYFGGPHEIHDPFMPFDIPDKRVVIIPQFEIGNYRVDFAVLVRDFNGNILRIVVECDGHEFHEKTKQQAQKDKKRDRDLQATGWQVYHFTGSEIYKDVCDCVDQLDLIGAKWIEKSIPVKRG